MNSAASIATKFRTDQVRVAVGIATPTSQALVQTIDNIPVVFTAVTDPVSAGLVESLENTPGNVTGYSDMTPVREQIEMMVELGGVQRLGHVYSSGEANAVTLANLAEEVCDVLDIEFVAATVTNSAEVRQATQSIVDRVDAIYVSTDNTVVSALNSLTSVALANNVPVVSADPSSAEEFDVLAAYGFDYYTMGRATGRLVARILDGEDPGSIPVQFLTDADDLILLLNLDVADSLGILVPDEVMERADKIVEDGQVRDN
jgi:putative ABC transport system substrate-binding protein